MDERGRSERPHRVRTWAPRGQTPVLQYHFNGETLAVMAGMTFVNFYFQLYEGTIKAPQVLRFLAHLQRHLQGKLILLWDRTTWPDSDASSRNGCPLTLLNSTRSSTCGDS